MPVTLDRLDRELLVDQTGTLCLSPLHDVRA
jgi:hypothetical protein